MSRERERERERGVWKEGEGLEQRKDKEIAGWARGVRKENAMLYEQSTRTHTHAYTCLADFGNFLGIGRMESV